MDFFEANGLSACHDEALQEWYRLQPSSVPPGADMRSLVLAQHYCNFVLWGLEDRARRRDVGDAVVADIKRQIDAWNQRRWDMIEWIDDLLLEKMSAIDLSSSALHSETAGMIIDRLSILSLKLRNMAVYAGAAQRRGDDELFRECEKKLGVLNIQRQDLLACLQQLFRDFAAGRRHFKSYRQFKAYNDPRLNPEMQGN